MRISIYLCLAALLYIFTPNYTWDISQNKVNSLSANTIELLNKLEDKLVIKVYSPQIETLNLCKDLLDKYTKQSPLISAEFNQQILDRNTANNLKLATDHNIVVDFKQRSYAADFQPNAIEESQINTLMQKIINDANNWLVFLTGHQEADIGDESPLGLSEFAKQFSKQGLSIARLNLSQAAEIPVNTKLLIIANPQVDLLTAEKILIHNYLSAGGALIWFSEPDTKVRAFLQEEFAVRIGKDVLLDENSLKLGSPHPAIKFITSYPKHAITNNINTASILPWSGKVEVANRTQTWDYQSFLTLGHNDIAVALTRKLGDYEQRAIVFGNSSFILNKYLPLYANAQLANNMIAWLQNDVKPILIQASPARDFSYQPSKTDGILFKYGFTLLLPILLIGLGVLAEKRF